MKKIIYSTLATAVLLMGAAGCRKTENVSDTKKTFSERFNALSVFVGSDTTPSYGLVSFTATKYGFGVQQPTFNLNGDFFSHEDKMPSDRIEVGDLSNGLFVITADANNNYNYSYTAPQKSAQSNVNLFGTSVNFSAAGSTTFGIPSFNTTLYNPSILTVTGTFVGGQHNLHSRTQDITINWNSDAGTPNNLLFIVLQYVEGASLRLDPNNPTDVPLKHYVVDDSDGNYTIPSSELSSLPSNCVMNLHVIRGNIVTATVNGKDYEFVCYSHIQQEFELN